MMGLHFDAETHTYSVNGVRLPSVTEVLAAAGIIDTTYFTEEAAWRGSVVHMACQLDDEGTLDESTVAPEVAGRLEAWRKFKLETGFKAQEIEKPRYHKLYHYAGTPDRKGRIGKIGVIVDLKSGAWQRWHALQLAGYAHLFRDGLAFQRIVVCLRDNGSYSMNRSTSFDMARHFNLFLSALNIWNWRNRD